MKALGAQMGAAARRSASNAASAAGAAVSRSASNAAAAAGAAVSSVLAPAPAPVAAPPTAVSAPQYVPAPQYAPAPAPAPNVPVAAPMEAVPVVTHAPMQAVPVVAHAQMQLPHVPPPPARARAATAARTPTCWCGVEECPDGEACGEGPLRCLAQGALMPFALVSYVGGLVLWGGLQLTRCCFFPCLASTFATYASTGTSMAVGAVMSGDLRSARQIASHTGRAVVKGAGCAWDCVDCWYKCDHFNGDLHVCFCPCEPESKYRLHGHLLEAPCQVCLWGARSATVVVAAPAGGVMPVRRRITNVFDLCFG